MRAPACVQSLGAHTPWCPHDLAALPMSTTAAGWAEGAASFLPKKRLFVPSLKRRCLALKRALSRNLNGEGGGSLHAVFKTGSPGAPPPPGLFSSWLDSGPCLVSGPFSSP